jgi:hypothetical protein
LPRSTDMELDTLQLTTDRSISSPSGSRYREPFTSAPDRPPVVGCPGE